MKWTFLILAIAIGFLGGYFVFHQPKSDITFVPLSDSLALKYNKASVRFANAGKIDPRLAKLYVDQFVADSNKHDMKVLGGRALKGFWIDSAAIFNMMRQDPACNGIRIYLAKNPFNPTSKKVYTLVFVGTKPKTTKAGDPPGDLLDNLEVYDFVDPCPDNCGSIGGN